MLVNNVFHAKLYSNLTFFENFELGPTGLLFGDDVYINLLILQMVCRKFWVICPFCIFASWLNRNFRRHLTHIGDVVDRRKREYPLLQSNTLLYRVAQKVSHYQMIKKSYQIVSKPVSDIKFLHQIKVRIKHYNILFTDIRYSMRDLFSGHNNYAGPPN